MRHSTPSSLRRRRVIAGTITALLLGAALGFAAPRASLAWAPKSLRGSDAASSAGPAVPPPPPPLHTMEGLILNPAGTDGGRFLFVVPALEVADAHTDTLLTQRDAEVRDVLVQVLSAQPLHVVTDIDARDALKATVLAALQRHFGPAVRRVFFPHFVVQ